MKTNYGQVVHTKRRLLRLTGEELAEHIDMSARHLRNIEKGNTMPKLDTVIKIGNALGMDLGDLNKLKIMEEAT